MTNSKKTATCLAASALSMMLLAGCGGSDKVQADDTANGPTIDVPVDITGTWMTTGDVLVGRLRLEHNEEAVTGTVDNTYGVQPISGTVFGYDLAFSFVQQRDQCEATLNCFATLFDEQMRGSCKLVTICPGEPVSTRNGRITLTRE